MQDYIEELLEMAMSDEVLDADEVDADVTDSYADIDECACF